MQTYGKVHIGKNLTKAPPQWWGGAVKGSFFKWGVVGVSFDYITWKWTLQISNYQTGDNEYLLGYSLCNHEALTEDW